MKEIHNFFFLVESSVLQNLHLANFPLVVQQLAVDMYILILKVANFICSTTLDYQYKVLNVHRVAIIEAMHINKEGKSVTFRSKFCPK
jgi:flagellar biosynthesis protein FliQ